MKNRERKYRGKRVDNGEWVEGSYRYSPYYDIHTISIFQEHAGLDAGGGVWREYEVIPETVGWFTGRKDKNGKVEIYKGSIITFLPEDFSTTIRQIAEVYYCVKRSAFCVKSKAWNMPLFNCKQIEVIGNVHDNPELLTQDKGE